MDISKLRSRRNILALALTGAASRVVPVRAMQLNAGCEYGITNGIVTIGGADCDLPVPEQMIDARTNADGNDSIVGSTSSQGTSSTGTTTTSSPSTMSTTSPQAERQARLQKHRSKRRDKKTNKRTHKETKNNRKHTRKRSRIDALITCDDFRTQKAAIEWLAQHPEDATALDPNGDRFPCVELTRVSCSQFSGADDAKQWLKFYGFVKDNNFSAEPFGLYDGDKICPGNG